MQLDGFTEVSPILTSGVYALCAKGVVIYVGKAKCMNSRIDAHRRAWREKRQGHGWIGEKLGIPGLQFDAVHIRPVPKHMLDAVEREMIDRYRPRYNVQLKSSLAIRAPISITIGSTAVVMNQTLPPGPRFERRV